MGVCWSSAADMNLLLAVCCLLVTGVVTDLLNTGQAKEELGLQDLANIHMRNVRETAKKTNKKKKVKRNLKKTENKKNKKRRRNRKTKKDQKKRGKNGKKKN